MYSINFYVPQSHLEQVKEEMFAAGAGKLGNYEKCCWQILGEGQFLPLPEAKPFVGEKEVLCREAEYKVEMICEKHLLSEVIQALKRSHPYETPAYHIVECYLPTTF